jgi:hypothetical protein
MTQTLSLPSEVYRKLAQAAAERGMTVESLLAAVSDLVVRDQPTEQDRQRSDRIDKLLDRFRSGHLNEADRQALDQLIQADYHAANTGADCLIGAKQRRARNGRSTSKRSRE